MRAFIALALALAGCQDIPSRGILQPAPASSSQQPTPRPTAGTPAAPTEGTGTTTGGFDFEGEDRKEEDDLLPEDVDEIELQADLLGVDPSQISQPAPAAPQAYIPAMPMPLWEPDHPLDGGWGLRVVATIHDVQPPRAVIATADGQELVVQPGQMLPNHRLVILAVGHGVVQVARVTPQGFYAKVETETVSSLAPAATPTR